MFSKLKIALFTLVAGVTVAALSAYAVPASTTAPRPMQLRPPRRQWRGSNRSCSHGKERKHFYG